jgi:hypothetical protein
MNVLNNMQFRALRGEEQRTAAILPNLNDLINMMDIRNMNSISSGYQSEILR